MSEAVRAIWCMSQNFGDQINLPILKWATGKEPVYCEGAMEEPHIIACGSIANWSNQHSTIWGAGLADPVNPIHPEAQVAALRGPLSVEVLRKQKFEVPDVYGDPAVLLPQVFPLSKAVKKYPLALIPHYIDQQKVYRQYGGKLPILNILATPEKFLRALVCCERVISSALHGIIAAHAFGIPVTWAKFTERIGGANNFKYRDYYASVGQEAVLSDVRDASRDVAWWQKRPYTTADHSDLIVNLNESMPAMLRRNG